MKNLEIIDLHGKKIEVTNLVLAIMQADDYRHYRFADPAIKQHPLYDYWEDVYQKLIALRERYNKE